MKYFLVVIFVSVFVPGHGQSLKLGIRTGVSFSNFHAHYSPRDFPYSTISGNPHTGSPVIIDPNLQNTSLYYYETDFVKDLRIGFFSYLNLQWEIKRKLSAEIGLGYTQKGISINYTLNSTV